MINLFYKVTIVKKRSANKYLTILKICDNIYG